MTKKRITSPEHRNSAKRRALKRARARIAELKNMITKLTRERIRGYHFFPGTFERKTMSLKVAERRLELLQSKGALISK